MLIQVKEPMDQDSFQKIRRLPSIRSFWQLLLHENSEMHNHIRGEVGCVKSIAEQQRTMSNPLAP